MEQTPRTDAQLQEFEDAYNRADEKGSDMSKWEGNLESKLKHFARSLERELSEVTRKLDRFTRISESGESLGGELEEREARIAAERELEASASRIKELEEQHVQLLNDYMDSQISLGEALSELSLVKRMLEHAFSLVDNDDDCEDCVEIRVYLSRAMNPIVYEGEGS